MNTFIKSFILAIILFLFHSIILSIITFIYNDAFGYYGFLGGIIYFFFFGFWAYYLGILIYLSISNSLEDNLHIYLAALAICLAGYIGHRVGDIIDHDFIRNFKLLPLLLFIFTSWIIVKLDSHIN